MSSRIQTAHGGILYGARAGTFGVTVWRQTTKSCDWKLQDHSSDGTLAPNFMAPRLPDSAGHVS